MSVMRREAYPYECPFLHNIHGAEHDAFDKAVHRETFHSSVLEKCVFHIVRHDKRRSIKKQPEIVGAVRIARHTVGLEVFQVFYPQFHLTSLAIPFVYAFRAVVPVLCDDKAYVCPVRADLNLGDDPLLVFPTFRLVVQLEIPSYDNPPVIPSSLGGFHSLFEIALGTLLWLVNHVQKPCVSAEASEVAHIPSVPGPIHKLMAAEMAIATQFDDRVRPAFVKVLNHAPENA